MARRQINHKDLIIRKANQYGVPPEIMLAIAEKESGFNPNAKNISDIESSYGLFQINTLAHPDYKGGNDPEANADYAARFLRNLYKKYGSWDKAIERYNGSGSQARAYAKDVINNRIPRYSNVKTDNITNNTGVNIKMAQRQQPNNKSFTQLVSEARTAQPLSARWQIDLAQFLSGELDYATLAARYPNEVAANRITPSMQQISRLERDKAIIDEATKIDPAIVRDMENAQYERLVNARNQMPDYAEAVKSNYQDYINAINNNPMLQNSGYYVDPADVSMGMKAKIAMQLAGGDPSKMITAQDIANARYQTEIANKYGVPYAELRKAQETAYNNEMAVRKQQQADLLSLYKDGLLTDRQLMAAVAQINSGKDIYQEGLKQKGALYGKAIEGRDDIEKAYVEGYLDLDKAAKEGQTDIITEGMGNQAQRDVALTNLQGNIYSADRGLEGTRYRADRGLEGTRYTADQATERQGMSDAAEYQRLQEELPYKQQNAFGNFLMGASMFPNANPRVISETYGYPADMFNVTGTPQKSGSNSFLFRNPNTGTVQVNPHWGGLR